MNRYPGSVARVRAATPPRLWILLGVVPLAIATICALMNFV